MKTGLFILMITFSFGVNADPFKTIITYECKKINKGNYGFKCNGVESGHLQLHIIKKMDEMSKNDGAKSRYIYESFIMKFIQLGGRYINVTASFWAKNIFRVCTAKNDRTGYHCYEQKE